MDFENDLVLCLEILRKGGTILYPTDTVWGIGCDATNADAVQKIYDLKARSASKSMIVLISDPRDINRYTSYSESHIHDYLKNTDRPTTVIYEGILGLADNLIAPDGTGAIRIVRDDFCRHLIKRFRKPIVSTSANISGQETPQNFSGISEEIKRGVDYIVKFRQDEILPGKSSSLVRFGKLGQPIILRP